jgi:tetratricopeptide (TPR) repeat protein
MNLRSFALLFLLLSWLPEGPAFSSGSFSVSEKGTTAAKGLPSARIQNLRDRLNDPDLLTEERLQVSILLAESLLETKRFSEVVSLANEWGEVAPPELLFLSWEASLHLGDSLSVSDEEIAAMIPMLPDSLRNRALLRFSNLENPLPGEEGAALFNHLPLLLKDYLQSVRQLKNEDWAAAASGFREILRQQNPLSPLAAVGLAECLAQTGQIQEAETLLEGFLSEAGGESMRWPVFEKLDELYARSEESSDAELRRLANDSSYPLRSVEARYFLVRALSRQGRLSDAIFEANNLLNDNNINNFITQKTLEQKARDLAGLARWEEVLEEIPEHLVGADGYFWRGVAAYRLGDFSLAEGSFAKAYEISENQMPEAAENAALMGVFQSVLAYDEEQYFRDDQVEASLTDEKAVILAASANHPAAESLLEEVAARGSSAAGLALAEWRFASGDREGAQEALNEILDGTAESEGAIYLRVFLADDGGSDANERVITTAEFFLRRFPDSRHAPEVAFKRGEALFRRGDYLSAKQAFEDVAVADPASDLASDAWFYAGQAASRLMTEESINEAIACYEEVARRGGALAGRARLEQALLKNALGEREDALRLLELVIESSGEDAELRYAAWIERGDTLATDPNPSRLEDAVLAWANVYDDEDAPARWRNQALCKAALTKAKLGERDRALALLFKVLEQKDEDDPETFWFAKSGFEAARILEESQSWGEAIALYRDLAAMEGPRAEEARTRANRIRLENFIWQD